MKLLCLAAICSVLIISIEAQSQLANCTAIYGTNCNSTTRICARFGSSDNCKLYANLCTFNISRCVQNRSNATQRIHRVNNSACRGSTTNFARRTCIGSAGSGNGNTIIIRG